MALPTSLALGALSVALLASQPASGWMAYLTKASPGARMARLLLPAVIVIPAGLSILRFAATRGELVSTSVGLWRVQLLTIALFCVITVVYAAVLDAGEQQRRPQALITSRTEQRFRELVEIATEGVWIVDPDHITVFANEALATMLGTTPGAMLGRPSTDFTDSEAKREAEMHLARRARGERERYELRLRRVNGDPIWVIVSAAPIFAADGSYRGSLSMLTDITERVRIERERQRALDQLEEAERTAGLGSWRFHPGSETWAVVGRHVSAP